MVFCPFLWDCVDNVSTRTNNHVTSRFTMFFCVLTFLMHKPGRIGSFLLGVLSPSRWCFCLHLLPSKRPRRRKTTHTLTHPAPFSVSPSGPEVRGSRLVGRGSFPWMTRRTCIPTRRAYSSTRLLESIGVIRFHMIGVTGCLCILFIY